MFRTFSFALILASAVAATASAHPFTTPMQSGLSTPDADGRWVMRTIPPSKLPTKNWEHVNASPEANARPDASGNVGGVSHWVKN